MVHHQLDLRPIKYSDPTFRDTGAMREDHFQLIIRFDSPETSLGCSRRSNLILLIDDPGTREVRQEWTAIVAKSDFLLEIETLSSGIFAMTVTAPGSHHPSEWIEIRMQTFWNLKCHYSPRFNLRKFLPAKPMMTKASAKAEITSRTEVMTSNITRSLLGSLIRQLRSMWHQLALSA